VLSPPERHGLNHGDLKTAGAAQGARTTWAGECAPASNDGKQISNVVVVVKAVPF